MPRICDEFSAYHEMIEELAMLESRAEWNGEHRFDEYRDEEDDVLPVDQVIAA